MGVGEDGLLRVVRGAMGIAIVVGLVGQFVHSRDTAAQFTALRFFSYFTVLSNCATVVLYAGLVARPHLRDEPGFAAYRGAVTLYMTITGLVYAVLLAPNAADVQVNLVWVDRIVHVVGPIVVLGDWLLDRGRVAPTMRVALGWLAFPVVYVAYTLLRGPHDRWYPYPFLDPRPHGYGRVAIMSAVVALTFVLVALGLRWWASRPQTTEPTSA